MYQLPKTTFTFSAYTFDEKTDTDNEVKIEFSSREETLDEVLEKMTDFLRAVGFGYVDELEAIKRTNFSNTNYDDPQFETDGASDQPYVSDADWDSYFESTGQVSADFFPEEEFDGQMRFNFGSDNPYKDVKVTYANSAVESDIKLDIAMQPVDLSVTPQESQYSFVVNTSPEVGNATVKVRNSIDDATPEEWDAVNRKIMNYTTK